MTHSAPRAVLLLLALVGCSDPAGPARPPAPTTWTRLAERLDAEDVRGHWMAVPIAPDAWVALEGGRWRAPAAFGPGDARFDASAGRRLQVDGRELAAVEGRSARLEPGQVRFGDDAVTVSTGDEPPGEAALYGFVPGATRAGEVWRVEAGRLVTDGFPLVDGRPLEMDVEAGPGTALRFGVSSLGPPASPGASLRILFADGVLFEKELAVSSTLGVARFEVLVPVGAGRLRFEVVAPDSRVAIHVPVLGPGSPPRPAPRPSIVLFVADTLRADCLSAYGGELGATPNIDAFVETGLRFDRAWSTAAWTLPATASMLLGLYPYEHGAVTRKSTPRQDIPSIAGQLAAAGYRTGAVTDSVYLSRHFGLDRGFEWFEEWSRPSIDRTLQSATDFLSHDDGRPAFLLVHSYRVHAPFLVAEEVIATDGERLGIRQGWDDVISGVIARLDERLGDEFDAAAADGQVLTLLTEGRVDAVAELEAMAGDPVEQLRRLYYGAAMDLDRGFGALLEILSQWGRDANTYVVFTSDHGEAFGEHGTLFHGVGTWDEVLRVPLVIRGPGIPPGVSDAPASLVDLPRTLAHLAGVGPHEAWRGAALTNDAADRPVFAFDCCVWQEPTAALIHEGLKFVLPASTEAFDRGELTTVYDLAADPGETRDARADGPLDEDAAALIRAARPLLDGPDASSPVELSDEARDRLQALGYGGADGN